ncbi:MAG: hypothetical protein GIS02_04370 [Methanosarcinales archaeon]|uniref:Uncharacterized protein n=1 Tax=Candidatus Ethanoperedens thermophilum TaxID=2766897 RepID=A0A848DA77_9EURY|nr:hypothetical protein [Candidatus Ethanoperedens thermophilum]
MLQITVHTLPPQGEEFGIEISGFDPLLGREWIEAFGIDAAEDLKGMGADCGIDGNQMILGQMRRCF